MVREKECEKCNKLMPSSELKLVFRGKGSLMALCPECRAKVGKSEVKAHGKAVPEKKTYYCSKCRYKFKFDPENGGRLVCPYCGDYHYVAESKLLSSETLIKNADKE